MDKTIILSVAGSGKTSHIVNNLNLEKRFLIITYTINNIKNIRLDIINKFGYFPSNIDLFSYFTFLHSFCFKPFLSYKIKSTGICWDFPPLYTNRIKRDKAAFYLTKDRRLYHNRIAKLLEQFNVLDDIKARLEKYYDYLYIDEIQDFAGHDFNLLKHVLKAKLEIELVGDFYQHTFDTSRDGNTNIRLHDDYQRYIKEFKNAGININSEYLNKSWRCSPTVCEYITNNLKIEIYSHKKEETKIELITDDKIVDNIYYNNKIIKLFYQESSKYKCYSKNWGDCKGENCYNDICVVLNKTTYNNYENGKLCDLNPSTKNKLYVALSRARGNVYIIEENLIRKYKI